MRRSAFLLTIGVFLSAFPNAQDRQADPAPPGPATAPLPVKRVVLYKTGVGYFEHVGNVRGDQNITIRFTSAQLNDVLKSLTAIDLGKGQISSVSYGSVAPLEQRLGMLRLPVDGSTTPTQLLASLRGARLEVTSGAVAIEGRLFSVEQRARTIKDESSFVDVLTIITDTGDLRTFELTPAVRVRILERDLRQEVGRYLDVVGSTREQDVRSMVISTIGSGERPLFVSYISEVPVWKTTYRLVIPKDGKPLLQGWAIIDNTIGEDWRNVELSLVAGAPQSFIQQISQPFYTRRPVVPMPSNVLLAPQTHAPTLEAGTGRLVGRVVDQAGGPIPGVTVSLIDAAGRRSTAITRADGTYEIAAAVGQHRVEFEVAGFRRLVTDVFLPPGEERRDATLQVGSVQETVSVSSSALATDALTQQRATGRRGAAGGVVGGLPAPPPPPPPPAPYEQMRTVEAAATGGELGDLFEYRIKEPVTLRKNQSALVPIVNTGITAEKVSLWNRSSGSGRPLRALWLTNSTGLTLDGGSMTIVDGDAFAGEGLVEAVKPGEKRFVSYAADLGLLVSATSETRPRRIFRARARDGILVTETEERINWLYKVRSEAAAPSTLIVEHPVRPGWKLAAGMTPVESTPHAHRFRTIVDAGKEVTIPVSEIMAGTSRVAVGDITSELIVQLTASGLPAGELERALKPVLDRKAELAAVDRRLESLSSQRDAIVQDQARLRENMKALRGSSEEKELLQRYTRQLNEQENRLDALQQEIAKATVEREKASAALANAIATLSFEVGG